MRFKANGEEVVLANQVTVEELLVLLKVEMPQYVTVQINDEFILREDFPARRINEGDQIEFLYFMGGGAR
ncbi:MAG: sulfur carrier protein ThiS [Syntrophomonadaceae bacterium]|nr:sulfur carrier protein ThiS [Syntrophomonadaceae bacterium]